MTGAFFVEFDNEETFGAKNGTNAKNNREKRICKMQMAFGGVGPTTRLATNAVENLQGMAWNKAFFDFVSARLAEEFCMPEDAPGGMAKLEQKRLPKVNSCLDIGKRWCSASFSNSTFSCVNCSKSTVLKLKNWQHF